MSIENKKQYEQLLQFIREAIERDDSLRKKYEVANKFRFIKEQLQLLLSQLESEKISLEAKEQKTQFVLAEDEVLVYVYLYNARGLVLRSWLNMLTPNVFYEYSVNRPIYSDMAYMLALLRAKPFKPQHGYLTIAIKKKDILSSEGAKDVNDNPLIKVKEGSLHFHKLITFTHNGTDYRLTEEGELVVKDDTNTP